MYAHHRNRSIATLGWLLHAVGVIILVGGGFTYHYFVSSLIARHGQMGTLEMGRLESVLSKADDIHARHERLTEEMASLERQAESMRLRIPDLPQETEFLRRVADAADNESLKILNWERGRRRETETHAEFEIRVVCEGSYQSICGFLDRMDNLPRVATVKKLNITAAEDVGVYPLDMTLMLYYGARSAEHKKT